MLFVVGGCASRPDTEERLLDKAFEAIQEKDWETYSKLTVTYADFLLKSQKTGRFEERLTYAGNVLKPEERQSQREQFDRAAAGGEGQIDFQRSRFVATGSVILESRMELLDENDTVPFKIYSVKVRLNGNESDTRLLSPHFTVVPWEAEYRLMRLEFPREEN
ncbi:MAG: hypothetical protein WEE20_03665 [Bacteroidota bacterium]